MTHVRRSPGLRSRGCPSRWQWRGFALMAVGAFALASCSSSPSSSGSGTTSTTRASNGSTTHAPNGSTTTSVSVPPYDASHNAHQEVAPGSCSGNASTGYTLTGTVRNSASSSRTYSITVDFVTNPGAEVKATRVVSVGPVDPDKSAQWSTPAAGQGQSNLTCVIRQSLWS